MVDVRPFRALRPLPAAAAGTVAPPYDVVTRASARILAAGRPDSFLHVSRPEIDLPDEVPADSAEVYAQAGHALRSLVARGTLLREGAPSLYAYRLQSGDLAQTGLVCCASVDDYENGVIATHETTRADKEADRVRHLDAVGAHDEPVLLVVRPSADFAAALAAATTVAAETVVVADDGVRHSVWPVTDAALVERLVAALAAIPRAYVADGHHRSAAAARVRDLRRGLGDDSRGLNAFLAVVIPTDEVRILGYDRVVADLCGLEPAEFLAALESVGCTVAPQPLPVRPDTRHEFAVRVGPNWYAVAAPPLLPDVDVVAGLGVSVLQDRILRPLLGIEDPRTDPRISFVGGATGLSLLEAAALEVPGSVAFALHPTSVDELLACADSGLDLPPKSTWFDPKLASGLFVHPFETA